MFHRFFHILRYAFRNYSSRKLIKVNRTFELGFKIHCRVFITYGINHFLQPSGIHIRKLNSIFIPDILLRVVALCSLHKTGQAVIIISLCIRLQLHSQIIEYIRPFVSKSINIRMFGSQLVLFLTYIL